MVKVITVVCFTGFNNGKVKAIIPSLNLFFPMFPFDPPENIRKPKVFSCFQGDQMGTLGRKGLKDKHKQFGDTKVGS